MPEISKIILYKESPTAGIQLEEMERFITDVFSIGVESKMGIVQARSGTDGKDKMILEEEEEISHTRVFDLKKPFQRQKSMRQSRNIQTKTMMPNNDITDDHTTTTTERDKNVPTPLYDGFELQQTITKILPKDDDTIDVLHVIITDRLVCTFDYEDYRYHARALIGANPVIISTSGIVEAPAKPRQYYIDMITCHSKERAQEINERYKNESLGYNDPRLVDAIKGYMSQAILYYYYAEEAFCSSKECRLFNAHWQRDLIYSQITNNKFCKRHADMIDRLRDKNSADPAIESFVDSAV